MGAGVNDAGLLGALDKEYWSCPGAVNYKVRGPNYLQVITLTPHIVGIPSFGSPSHACQQQPQALLSASACPSLTFELASTCCSTFSQQSQA